jgi:YD repeat-containing protein
MSVQEGTKTATSFTYYEPSGLVQTIHTPTPGQSGTGATVTTSFAYDSLGNIVTATSPGNDATATITTTFNYTTDGGYSQPTAIDQPLTITDNLGKVTHLRYDARGNAILVVDPTGRQTDTTYNLADQPLTITYPATGETGPGRAFTTTTYQFPGGLPSAVTHYDESGAQVRQVAYTYGKEGELLSRSGSMETTSYSYDAAGRLITFRDGKNQATTYSYGSAGYLASIAYPGGGTVQYPLYDAAGNLLRRIDGQSVQTDYLYGDQAGNLSDVQYPATPSLNVHLTYDAYGRRASMSDGAGTTTEQYDDLDNPTSVTTTYAGLPARTISYSYYANGSRQTMGTPAGSFAYSYRADGDARRASPILTVKSPRGATMTTAGC